MSLNNVHLCSVADCQTIFRISASLALLLMISASLPTLLKYFKEESFKAQYEVYAYEQPHSDEEEKCNGALHPFIILLRRLIDTNRK